MNEAKRYYTELLSFGQWEINLLSFSKVYPRNCVVEISFPLEPLAREVRYRGEVFPKGLILRRSLKFFVTLDVGGDDALSTHINGDTMYFVNLPKELRHVILREVLGPEYPRDKMAFKKD